MDNVYDIKRKKHLDLILPKQFLLEQEHNTVDSKSVLIIMHFYYYERVEMYLKYIMNIPEEIDIIFTISDMRIKELLEKCLGEKKSYKFIVKENRGRDISAFLVACRQEILKYEYVCFLHDKKEKNFIPKADTDKWIYCLWENTLGSEMYIKNILCTFKRNKSLGLLTPPIPLTDNFSFAYENTWGENFVKTKELVEKLRLQCDLNPDKPPIALGTVFWCRVSALKKLFKVQWEYSDFDPEPLRNDGTLSHAIERSLPYIAQDAGYESGWIMTDDFAAERFEYQNEILVYVFGLLKEQLNVRMISQVKNLPLKIAEIEQFKDNFDEIYLYGAGKVGQACCKVLITLGLFPKAFIESEESTVHKYIFGIPVKGINQVDIDEKKGIIVAVGAKYEDEICNELRKRHVSENQICYWSNKTGRKNHG